MEPEKQRHIAKRRGCNRDRKSKYCLSTCALGKAVQSDSALFFSPSANWLTCLSTSAAESTAGCCLAWAGGKLVLFFHPLQVMNPVCSPHQLKPHEQLHRRAHSVSQFDGCLFPFPALFHSLSLSLSLSLSISLSLCVYCAMLVLGYAFLGVEGHQDFHYICASLRAGLRVRHIRHCKTYCRTINSFPEKNICQQMLDSPGIKINSQQIYHLQYFKF